jgi:hypothetical protein
MKMPGWSKTKTEKIAKSGRLYVLKNLCDHNRTRTQTADQIVRRSPATPTETARNAYCILRYDLAIGASRPLPTIKNDSVGALIASNLFIERRAIRKHVVVFGSLLLSANFPK